MSTKRRHPAVIALLAVALVAGCDGTPTSPEPAVESTSLTAARAAHIEHEVIRISVEDEIFVLPCVGEPISFNGFVQFVFHEGSNRGVDPDLLVQHVVSQPGEKLTGVGLTTGATYRFNSSISIAAQSPDDADEFPLSYNEIATSLLTRNGDGVVWLATVRIRIVIDANGLIRVDRFEITSDCP